MPDSYKKPVFLTMEEAKRYAQKIFPNNPRAQELMKNALLGNIAMDEKTKLDELLKQQGFEYEKLTADL